MAAFATRRNKNFSDWFLVRADKGGVPGEQNGIRSTSNQVAFIRGSGGAEEVVPFAESFIGLYIVYEGLDPDASYRVVARYITLADEPRVQRLLANGVEIHGPMRLSSDSLEELVLNLPEGIASSGSIRFECVPEQLPEIAGETEKVADPPVIQSIELWSDRQAGRYVLDVATAPGRTVLVRVLEIPFMKPVREYLASVQATGDRVWDIAVDVFGNGVVSLASFNSPNALGDSFEVSVSVGGEALRSRGVLDEAFFSSWPLLVPPPTEESADGSMWVLEKGWEFGVADSPGGRVSTWSPIEVPGQWFQQGFEVPSGQLGVYRVDVKKQVPQVDQRVFLEFGAVYSHAWVYLDETLVGEHEGGFTPFQLEVSDHLGGSSKLFIFVDCRSVTDKVSAASDYAAHELGGITRETRLISGPSTMFSRFHVEASFRADGVGEARVFGAFFPSTPGEHRVFDFEIVDAAGAVVARAEIVAEGEIFDRLLELRTISPWTAETPVLYSARASMRGFNYSVSRSIGFRSIEIVGDSLQVNGSPIRLRGVERHEQHPLFGRRTDPATWALDVALMKGCNVNNVFTCHYPHPEGFLDVCDREGLWVIDESPTVWVDSRTADSRDEFVSLATPILEMIERDRSRPSVVVWMLADECSWGRNFWRLVTWLRHERLLAPLMFSFDTGGDSSLDVASRHYPPADFAERLSGVERPVTFDQHTHVNCYNRREVETDPEVRDWWGRPMKQMWEAMRSDSRLLGSQVWAWSDDEFHLSSNTVVGYGEWGIVDAWRRTKPEWWNLKMAYCPVRLDETTILEVSPGLFRVGIENDFDFIGLDQIKIGWSIGNRSGLVECNLPARTQGIIEFEARHQPEEDEPLVLRATHNDGRLIGAWTIRDVPQSVPHFAVEGGPVFVSERRAHVFAPNLPEYDAERVRVGPVDWLFDTESALLKSVTFNRHSVIHEGPMLSIVPAHWTQHVGPHHRRGIIPLSPMCTNPALRSFHWDGGKRRMRAEIDFKEASLVLEMVVNANGELSVSYVATAQISVEPRQLGMVFTLPRDYQEIGWERAKTLWSAYPENHIARRRGAALAHPYPRMRPTSTAPVVPSESWELDDHPLGCADFRSTKRDLAWFRVRDATGASLVVTKHPDSDLHARAWDAGTHVALLIAAHSSGGSEPLLARADQHMGSRMHLRPGDEVSGAFSLKVGVTS